MHPYWFGVSLWFEEMLNLSSSLEPCRCQSCRILWKYNKRHKMCLFVCAVMTFQFLMQQSHHSWWQAVPWTSSSFWYRAAMFSPPFLPDFVGQIQTSVDPATCTIRLSLIELRIFSAFKDHSVPYKDKWKGVQAVNLFRFTFFPTSFLQLLDHSGFEILAGAATL